MWRRKWATAFRPVVPSSLRSANASTWLFAPGFQLVAAPVQYDEQPAVPGRAPEFNEHGDDILRDLGLDWDTIVDLKVRGAVG